MHEKPGVNDVAEKAFRRHYGQVYRYLLIVAVGAAALIAVLLWPSGGKHTSILDRASAAIGDGPVMHVVIQTPSGFQLIELSGGRTITPTDERESWSDRGSQRVHVVVRERGRVVEELLRPDDPGSTLGETDPAFEALWTCYQKALADKTAKLIGKGSIYGHRVYWLQFPLPDHGGPGSQVAVDQGSYRPVAFRQYAGPGGFFHERVLLVRTEPFSESDFRRKTARRGPLNTRVRRDSGALAPAGEAMADCRSEHPGPEADVRRPVDCQDPQADVTWGRALTCRRQVDSDRRAKEAA